MPSGGGQAVRGTAPPLPRLHHFRRRRAAPVPGDVRHLVGRAQDASGRRPHPGAAAFTDLIVSVQRCLDVGAQARRPSAFLAFQLWWLLHGMTDLRAGKPEMPWPGTNEMTDHLLVSLGLRATRPARD